MEETRTPTILVDAYQAGVEAIWQAIDGLSRDELLARPIDGKWSTLEVVCHLADTEIYQTDRIERTLALERPLLLGVDEQPYVERLQFQQQSVEEELELMEILRRRTARILRRQPAEVWDRTAVHSEAGLCTLRDLVTKGIRHVEHHLAFIAEKRAALLASRTAAASDKPATEFNATILWENGGPDFERGKYSREHRWSFDGGVSIPASPSPHVVPAPWSAEQAIDPEEALVAAASSCHMLTFLWIASKKGWMVKRYEDKAMGTMTKNADRIAWVSRIALRPRIEWGEHRPDDAAIFELHRVAHEQCFIANSIKSRIVVEPSA